MGGTLAETPPGAALVRPRIACVWRGARCVLLLYSQEVRDGDVHQLDPATHHPQHQETHARHNRDLVKVCAEDSAREREKRWRPAAHSGWQASAQPARAHAAAPHAPLAVGRSHRSSRSFESLANVTSGARMLSSIGSCLRGARSGQARGEGGGQRERAGGATCCAAENRGAQENSSGDGGEAQHSGDASHALGRHGGRDDARVPARTPGSTVHACFRTRSKKVYRYRGDRDIHDFQSQNLQTTQNAPSFL